MKVAVVGSGGREHALAWGCSRSPSAEKVYVLPGNPGTAQIAENVDIDPLDFESIARFCHEAGVDLVVVGPEGPLAAGIGDFLRKEGILVFGPDKRGAMLESSKGYARDFMARHGIPHPRYEICDTREKAISYIDSHEGPYVIKADGLALGKGVSICDSREEARSIVNEMMSGKLHGEAGKKVVMEEFLTGYEVTAMAFVDGKNIFPLPIAQDHKRLLDGNLGPMTGGMGAYCPVEFEEDKTSAEGVKMEEIIRRDILERTLRGFIEENIDFRGVIYAGLIITEEGPKVLEYNVRFGDPEAQCVLPLIEGDLVQMFQRCAAGDVGAGHGSSWGLPYVIKPGYCVVVVLASGGYPGSYKKGIPISGLVPFGTQEDNVIIFHAGTKEENGELVTSGGRVLSVAGLGSTLSSAREKAYDAVKNIKFEGAYYRKDIARV